MRVIYINCLLIWSLLNLKLVDLMVKFILMQMRCVKALEDSWPTDFPLAKKALSFVVLEAMRSNNSVNYFK